MAEISVWVLLLGLPFAILDGGGVQSHWKYMSFLETRDKRLARIVVRLDPREGLVEEIHLKYKELSYTQIIDYEQLPFHSHTCHKYGHLIRDFPLGFKRRIRHKGEARNMERIEREEEELAQEDEIGIRQEGEQEPMEIKEI